MVSTDDTADRAEAAGARVLQLPFNGGAVHADFKPLLRGDD